MVIPPLQAYRGGSQGLLDEAINSAMSEGLGAHLQTLDASRFHTVADEYVEKLNAWGFSARRLPLPVDLASLPAFKSESSGEFAERDLRSLGASGDIDTLILLSVYQCGTLRSYYAFIPLGAPVAICMSKGEMIDLKTNAVRWRAYPEMDASVTVKVSGEWDEPPDYRNVTAAIAQAITHAQGFLVKEFFGKRPLSACTDTPGFRNASAAERDQMLASCSGQ
ncbi:hypothetical protein HPC49_09795 [Pyxidicoccus fallax]|uniref:Uncharacterized protein n=1 Tax=Pyxidicoccus fallax TaxID=394095 RepID=A0A848LA05_9BACT|nr:hypothetical protein [Pyxidicoccus fallax]NMO13513.1 hypothetical protein [Pyxidicoccus fallax]NPC78536.1 hypothetical protein [Pyxidicoccus fallax]